MRSEGVCLFVWELKGRIVSRLKTVTLTPLKLIISVRMRTDVKEVWRM